MGKIVITMTTVREIDENEYEAWKQSLVWAGYPKSVIEHLDKDKYAVWSELSKGVETHISYEVTPTKNKLIDGGEK